MKNTITPKARQGGAVAIIVGIFTLFVMIPVLGLVIDLGRTYVAKTELQNAADAAALSGARELNGDAGGINNALASACMTAHLNSYNFGTDVVADPGVCDDITVGFGSSPDGSFVPAASVTNPGSITFVEVNTNPRSLTTFIMQALGISQTSTKGYAVAGFTLGHIMPLGVCAIDIATSTDPDSCDGTGAGGQTVRECGFRRGVAYNFKDLSPIANGDMGWLHPTATTRDDCQENQANANFPLPFICQGISSVTGSSVVVITNTGVTATKAERAVNSRFGGNNTSPYSYERSLCTPDTNIKEYPYNAPCTPSNGNPSCWMTPAPTRQASLFNKTTDKPDYSTGFSAYGVLWSYAHERNFGAGANYTLDDWGPAPPAPGNCGPTATGTNLYGGCANKTNYPASAPYFQTSGRYFQAPTAGQGLAYAQPNRRIVNVVIVDCTTKVGGVCREIPILGFGSFFLQVQATLPQSIIGEFVREVPRSELFEDPDIELFR